jgi:putative ABC transport system substrate-binding protein
VSGTSPHADRGHQVVWTRRRVLYHSVAVAGIGILPACGCVPSVGRRSKVPTVGFVSPVSDDLEQFLRPFRALGYVEGQTVTIASRTAVQDETAEQQQPVVEELVRLPADVIVAVGSTVAGAAKGATRSIPVVFFGVGDAVALGLVTSVARPEGNVTGVTNITPQAIGKGVEYLLQIVPGIARVAFVGNLGGNPGSSLQLVAAEATARTLGIQIVHFPLRDARDIDPVFESFSNSGVNAVMVGSDGISTSDARTAKSRGSHFVEIAARYRLPTIYARREFVDAGGLICYGPSYPALWERLAVFVDKILRGKAPGDLPVEQPKTLDLVVNSKTARALGISVPPSILMQAEVIQ